MLVQHRVNDAVRANERTGMRLRGALSSCGAPDFKHHEWLVRRRTFIRSRQKPVGIAELLDKTADALRMFVIGEKLQAIGKLKVRLVARADGMRHPNPPIDAYLHHIDR